MRSVQLYPGRFSEDSAPPEVTDLTRGSCVSLGIGVCPLLCPFAALRDTRPASPPHPSGALIGMVAGALLGLTLAGQDHSCDNSFVCSPGEEMGAVAFFGAVVGGVVGLIIGGTHHEDVWTPVVTRRARLATLRSDP